MSEMICHTCETAERAEQSETATRLLSDHVRDGHHVTRRPAEVAEHGERSAPGPRD